MHYCFEIELKINDYALFVIKGISIFETFAMVLYKHSKRIN